MAEINKLSVGRALDKLRETNSPETKLAQLDGNIERLDEEIERLKVTRRSLERNQRTSPTGRDVQEANAKRVLKPTILWIVVGTVIVISISALTYALL